MPCVVEKSADLEISSGDINNAAIESYLVEGLSEELEERCIADEGCDSSAHIYNNEHEEARAKDLTDGCAGISLPVY